MIQVGQTTSSNCCPPAPICCPPTTSTNSGSYIWNQFNQIQPANYRIDGVGELGILNVTQGQLQVIGTPISNYMEYVTNAAGVGQRFFVGEENLILTLGADGNSRFMGRTAGLDAVNDDEYITKGQLDDYTYTETDPTVPTWVKAITQTQINNWTDGYNNQVTGIDFNAGTFTLTQLDGGTLTTPITSDDVAEGTTNLYYTNARVKVYGDTQWALINHSHDLASSQIYGILPISKGGTGMGTLGTSLQILRVNVAGTALEYANASGLITETDPTVPIYVKAIQSTDIDNWNSAYNNQITSAAFTGTTTKTLTLTQQDGGTLTATFTDLQGVTSVGLAMPTIFTVSGSPVTSTGTLTATLATQSPNTVFAGPATGGAAIPTFRALVAADIPNLAGNYIQNQFAAAQTTANFWVSGNGRVGGTFTADQGGFNSDVTFKDVSKRGNEIDISILNKLEVIEYTWKDKNDGWVHYGYSAQDIEKLVPTAVITGGEKLSVNYTEIHTLALAEAARKIAKLEAIVADLESRFRKI